MVGYWEFPARSINHSTFWERGRAGGTGWVGFYASWLVGLWFLVVRRGDGAVKWVLALALEWSRCV